MTNISHTPACHLSPKQAVCQKSNADANRVFVCNVLMRKLQNTKMDVGCSARRQYMYAGYSNYIGEDTASKESGSEETDLL